MPCYDSRNSTEYIEEQYNKRINELTQMLCALCQKVEGINPLIIAADVTLNAWWQEHQRKDMERQKRELHEQDQEAKITKLLSKLTLEERLFLKSQGLV